MMNFTDSIICLACVFFCFFNLAQKKWLLALLCAVIACIAYNRLAGRHRD